MPRRNVYAICCIAIVSLVCYEKADGAHRGRYGRMFDTFTEVLEQVEENYVEPVHDRELFEGALEGMVTRLDPYSAYYPPQDAAESRASLEQQFGGIGIEVAFDRETKLLTVMSPLVGTPAYEAGILAGDKIVKINDDSTEGFSMDDALHRLRGKVGESVRITVLHEGQTEPVEFKITRAIIQIDSVLGDSRNPDGSWKYFLPDTDGIAYIRITTFGKKTADELRTVLKKLSGQGLKGLVIDLRNNSGGLLTAAIETADLFIASGRIVSTRGRGNIDLETHDASGQAPYTGFPMAVLINRFSASASEIVAASLQDHQRATIVGQRSFGKGTVQSVIPLEDGRSELRLTIATYWRPSGENINRAKNAKDTDQWGVTPDEGFEVKLSDQELLDLLRRRQKRDAVKRGPNETTGAEKPAWSLDPQLRKAVEAIQAKSSSAPHG